MWGNLPYPYAMVGTALAIVLAFLVKFVGRRVIDSTIDPKERYRRYKYLNTAIVVLFVLSLLVLWGRLLKNRGTFFRLIGAGLAIALKEPLLSVAGRIAIFAGHMYSVGDRVEINKMTGDVIDVGMFYTRLMEIGNWITADQQLCDSHHEVHRGSAPEEGGQELPVHANAKEDQGEK